MWPNAVVLDEPIGQFLVHDHKVGVEVSLPEELLFKGTVEALQDSIIFWRPGPGPVVGEL